MMGMMPSINYQPGSINEEKPLPPFFIWAGLSVLFFMLYFVDYVREVVEPGERQYLLYIMLMGFTLFALGMSRKSVYYHLPDEYLSTSSMVYGLLIGTGLLMAVWAMDCMLPQQVLAVSTSFEMDVLTQFGMVAPAESVVFHFFVPRTIYMPILYKMGMRGDAVIGFKNKRAILPKFVAHAISNICFGYYHYPNLASYIGPEAATRKVILIFAMGMILSATFEIWGLLACVGAHALYNAGQLLLFHGF